MQSIRPFLDSLAANAHADGGWGYSVDQPFHLEPTCLALLALSLDRDAFAPTIDKALARLRQSADDTGAFRLERGREEAIWPTALALFVFSTLNCTESEIDRTARRLLAHRGITPEKPPLIDVHDIDLQLVGWSWAEGTFSWAEPTAWACLALRRAGFGSHPRVQEGTRLLIDRTFEDGGINYGNRFILGRRTEPIPGPTALMLLALQGRTAEPRIDASVAYLRDTGLPGDDLDHACWARLALDLYRDRPGVEMALPELEGRILGAVEDRSHTPYLKPAPVRIALTALALAPDQNNVFRLPSVDSSRSEADVLPLNKPAKKRSLGERIRTAFQGLAVEAIGRLRQPPPQTNVHIAKAADYQGDLADILSRQFETFRSQIPLKGKRVVLKPNLVEYHRDKVINTNPAVVAAVIELCKREGAGEIIVAEGPGHWRNVEYLVRASGLGDVLRHYNVPFVDINQDEPHKTPNLGRLTGLPYLYLSKTVATADVLISLPKLKTHHWAGATLSLKNLFGTLPGTCYGWPKNELHWRGIENSIVDIALTRTPDLAIVDGIVGMEGDGPLNGTPKPTNALIMGNDLLAVDATCCRLMKLSAEKVGYLSLGAFKRLGLLDEKAIQQVGEPIADLAQAYATVEHMREITAGFSA